jgi:hypothetical protein
MFSKLNAWVNDEESGTHLNLKHVPDAKDALACSGKDLLSIASDFSVAFAWTTTL